MNVSTRPAIAAIAASFDRTGAPVPPVLADALTRRTELVDRFATRPIAARDALTVAVLAALEDGVDPAIDPEVQRVVASHHLGGLHGLAADLEGILLDGIREAASTAAPAIHASWAEVFDGAADALTAAHGVLGAVDLDDTAAVLKVGPDAAASWATARDAIGAIEAIVAGWLGLHQLLKGAMPNKSRRLLIVADIAPETWLSNGLDGSKPDPWLASRNGYTLDLCAVRDFGARSAAIDALEREHNDDMARRRHDAATGRRALA